MIVFYHLLLELSFFENIFENDTHNRKALFNSLSSGASSLVDGAGQDFAPGDSALRQSLIRTPISYDRHMHEEKILAIFSTELAVHEADNIVFSQANVRHEPRTSIMNDALFKAGQI